MWPLWAALIKPPGRAFHLCVALAGALQLWSWSVPGFAFFTYGVASLLSSVLAGLWLVKLVADAGRRRRIGATFAVAPAAAVVVALLLAADVPFEARWAMSRSFFEAEVQRAGSAGLPEGSAADWVGLDVPGRLGAYRVTEAYRVGDGGVVFFEANGNLFDNAGFAYLPNGPSPGLENESFEAPQFRHLEGKWYVWTASW